MWFDPLINGILHSPLHGMLSSNTMLVQVTGRKTGKIFSTPVNYLRDGNCLWVISLRQRTWWHNLRDGAPMNVRLAGCLLPGLGEVMEDPQAVAESLQAYFQKTPRHARYFKIALDANNIPIPLDCEKAAQEHVVVKISLN